MPSNIAEEVSREQASNQLYYTYNYGKLTRDGCTLSYCYFLGDPNGPPHTHALNLLGLTAVINQIRLIFDGATSVQSHCGVLVVEKR